jgi:sulfonate transport system substrate-binding protein
VNRHHRPGRRHAWRPVALAALLLALSLVAGACRAGDDDAGAAAAAEPAGVDTTTQDLSGVTLRVGDQSHTAETLLDAAGQLEDLPYDITWTDFAAGPPLMEAINAGEIDLGGVGDTPPIFAQSAGTPFKIVGSSRADDPDASALAVLVPEGSDVEEVADLEGQRVAFTEGSAAHYFVIRALDEVGLTLDDVEPVPLAPPDALAAFQGGNVDAWAVWDPFVALAEESGAETVVTGSGLVPGYSFQVAGTGALDDPAVAEAIGDYLLRYRAAADWAIDHREQWSQLYAENTGLPSDVVENSFERFETRSVPITDEIITNQQEEADTFFEAGLIPEAIEVSQIFDTRYADLIAAAIDEEEGGGS